MKIITTAAMAALALSLTGCTAAMTELTTGTTVAQTMSPDADAEGNGVKTPGQAVKVSNAVLGEAEYTWMTFDELERLVGSEDLMNEVPESEWHHAINVYNAFDFKDSLCADFIDLTENRTNHYAYWEWGENAGLTDEEIYTSSIVINWGCV